MTAALVLVGIDVQEAYRAGLFEYEPVAAATARMRQVATPLGAPILVTEQ